MPRRSGKGREDALRLGIGKDALTLKIAHMLMQDFKAIVLEGFVVDGRRYLQFVSETSRHIAEVQVIAFRVGFVIEGRLVS